MDSEEWETMGELSMLGKSVSTISGIGRERRQ